MGYHLEQPGKTDLDEMHASCSVLGSPRAQPLLWFEPVGHQVACAGFQPASFCVCVCDDLPFT